MLSAASAASAAIAASAANGAAGAAGGIMLRTAANAKVVAQPRAAQLAHNSHAIFESQAEYQPQTRRAPQGRLMTWLQARVGRQHGRQAAEQQCTRAQNMQPAKLSAGIATRHAASSMSSCSASRSNTPSHTMKMRHAKVNSSYRTCPESRTWSQAPPANPVIILPAVHLTPCEPEMFAL